MGYMKKMDQYLCIYVFIVATLVAISTAPDVFAQIQGCILNLGPFPHCHAHPCSQAPSGRLISAVVT